MEHKTRYYKPEETTFSLPNSSIEPILQYSMFDKPRQEGIPMIWLRLWPILERSEQDGGIDLDVSKNPRHTIILLLQHCRIKLIFISPQNPRYWRYVCIALNGKWMHVHPLVISRCTSQSEHYYWFRLKFSGRVAETHIQDRELLPCGSGGMVQELGDQLSKVRYLIRPILTTMPVSKHWTGRKE